RRAGRLALEHTGKDAHFVRLAPLGGEARCAGATLVEPWLDIRLTQGKARRAAIHHRADRRPVTLSPCGEAEDPPEGVEAHEGLFYPCQMLAAIPKSTGH